MESMNISFSAGLWPTGVAGSALLSRLLRRESVALAVLVLKSTLAAAAALVFLLSVWAGVRDGLDGSAATAQMLESTAERLQEVATGAQTDTLPVDPQVLVRNNPFPPLQIPTKAVEVKPPAPTISKIPLLLLGTFITEGSSSYAIIEDQKNRTQEAFSLGETIFGAAQLTAIAANQVTILRDGIPEILQLDDSIPPAAGLSTGSRAADRVVTVEESELNRELENLPLLLTQARAVPYFKDGKSVGLRMFAIRKDSLYERIGIMNGDVLKSINGQSLADITQAIKLFERLRDERDVVLTLERNREEQQIRYQIR